jgi:hypothetical protein
MMTKWKTVATLLILALLGATAALAAETETHDMTVTISSVNVQEKTISFKNAEGKEMTAPVLEPAMESLKDVHAGEKVVLTCKDKDGKHMGVTAIRSAKA